MAEEEEVVEEEEVEEEEPVEGLIEEEEEERWRYELERMKREKKKRRPKIPMPKITFTKFYPVIYRYPSIGEDEESRKPVLARVITHYPRGLVTLVFRVPRLRTVSYHTGEIKLVKKWGRWVEEPVKEKFKMVYVYEVPFDFSLPILTNARYIAHAKRVARRRRRKEWLEEAVLYLLEYNRPSNLLPAFAIAAALGFKEESINHVLERLYDECLVTTTGISIFRYELWRAMRLATDEEYEEELKKYPTLEQEQRTVIQDLITQRVVTLPGVPWEVVDRELEKLLEQALPLVRYKHRDFIGRTLFRIAVSIAYGVASYPREKAEEVFRQELWNRARKYLAEFGERLYGYKIELPPPKE